MKSKAEHWMTREWRVFMRYAKDPLAWAMLAAILLGGGLMLLFLLSAADNFGAYYTLPRACAAEFNEIRLFFLTLLAPLFFVSVFVTMGEFSVVLGLRRKQRRVKHKFLFTSLGFMIILGATSS